VACCLFSLFVLRISGICGGPQALSPSRIRSPAASAERVGAPHAPLPAASDRVQERPCGICWHPASVSCHSWPEMMEHDMPSSISDPRLTSDSSVFGDIDDDEPKAIGFLPDEDDSRSAPVYQTAVVVLPTISRVPVPSLPVVSGSVLSLPPDRLNSPLPHRPTSSYLDLCENI
jgi:hypothetical protein